MKTLRQIATLVITAVTFLTVPDALRAAEPISISETQTDAQVSGTLPNSRAGLMTLGSLGGLNEVTIGAVPSVGLSGNFGDNYWQEDFYTLDAFLPWNVNPGTDYFYGEVGVSLTEEGRAVGNIGAGYAYYLANLDRLLRMGNYFTLDGQYERTRASWSLRAESLGKYVDVLSGIQIITTDSDDVVGRGLTGQEGFSGNNYLLQGLIVQETAFHNADIEVGGPLPYLGDYGISAYAKGYYMLNTQADLDSLGFGFRSEWSLTEDVIFNVNYTKDDIFDHSTWFNIAVSTPDGAPRNFLRPISTRERFSKRVQRTGRIPTKVEQRQFSTPLLNPKTGTPYFFAHLDPNATGNGTGTFENPYNNIDAMVAANEAGGGAGIHAFYVRPRTDGTSTNLTLLAPPERPLALRPNQMLLGSNIDQTIDIMPSVFSPTGTYTISALDAGLAAPVLMNASTNANAIVYASRGNLISGLTFDGGGVHDGVRLHSTGVLPVGINPMSPIPNPMGDGFGQDLHIRNNTFQNTVVGVNANDLSDGTPMAFCSLLGHSTLWNNTFTNNGTAYDITINAANNDGPPPNNADPFDGLQLTLSILNNTISNNTNGGHVTANGVDPTMPPGNNFARVDLIGNEDANGSGTLTANEDLNGDGLLTQRDLNGDGIPDTVFAGNTTSGNANHGFAFFANNGGQIYLQAGALPDFVQPDPNNPVFFNTFSGDGGDGLHLEANSSNLNGASSYIGGTIIANNFSNPGAGGDGLGIDANGQGMNFVATPSFIDFGQTARFEGMFDDDGDGIIENTIDLTTPNGGVPGFAGLQTYSGVIRGNLFDRRTSGNDGVEINVTNSSGDFDFINNTFIADQGTNAAAGAGINSNLIAGSSPNLYQNSQIVMSIGGTTQGTGNVFTNNGDAGVIFSTEGFVGSPTRQQDRSFLSVQNNLFEGTFDNGAPSNVSPDGAGVFIRRSGASLLTALVGDGIANNGINGNMFNGNDVGVQVVGAGSEQSMLNNFSQTLVYVDDNMFDGNGNGLQYDLTADAVLQTFVVTNSIINSTNDAIQVTTNNNSSFGLPVNPLNGEDLNNDGQLQQWEDLNFNSNPEFAPLTVLSSVFDSNFIQGFGGDGFDATAVGGSFQNVRISGRQLDQFGNQLRTIIDGQGAGGNGIELEADASSTVQQSPNANLWTIQGVDIIDAGVDGIHIDTSGGQNIFVIGSPEQTGNPFGGQFVRVQGSGDDGFEAVSEGVALDNFFIDHFSTIQNGDDGAAFFQDGLSNVAAHITNSVFNENEGNGLEIDIRSVSDSIDAGFSGVYNIGTEDTTTTGSLVDTDNDGVKGNIVVSGFTFMDEDTNNNGVLDGIETDLNGDGILNVGEDTTLSGAAFGAATGLGGNTFNNNNEQGVFFQTLADSLTGNLAGSSGLLVDGDMGIDPRNVQGQNNNPDTFPNLSFDGENEAFLFADPTTTAVATHAILNFVGNQVTNNGTRAGNPVDGMVLQIGTNTQQFVWLDGNLFGGNQVDDLRTQVVVSSSNMTATNTAGNPNRTNYQFDPVAFLDISMGENYTLAGTGVPPLIDPNTFNDTPQGPSTVPNPNGANVGNFGESVFINIDGESTALFGRTEIGLFTNSDIVKPAGRQATGVFTFYDSTGTGANLAGPSNTFTQSFGFSGPGLIPPTLNTTGALIRPGFDTLIFTDTPFVIQ